MNNEEMYDIALFCARQIADQANCEECKFLFNCNSSTIKEIGKIFIEAMNDTKSNGWISVKDRLPDKYCEDGISYNVHHLLVTQENGCVCEAWWDGDDFRILYYNALYKVVKEINPVIAWRPLPTAYEVEQ